VTRPSSRHAPAAAGRCGRGLLPYPAGRSEPARRRCRRRQCQVRGRGRPGAPVRCRVFDVALSSFGVMFFGDPAATFATSGTCGSSLICDVSPLTAAGARRLLPVLRGYRRGKTDGRPGNAQVSQICAGDERFCPRTGRRPERRIRARACVPLDEVRVVCHPDSRSCRSEASGCCADELPRRDSLPP
jgi:hypothetical protein